MATIVLPRSLLQLFPAAEHRVTLPGATVADLIQGLDQRWPGLQDRLCDTGPMLREHIKLFVDGEPADLEAPVTEGSVVHVIPAISGGAGQVGAGRQRRQFRLNRSAARLHPTPGTSFE
jgi:molybdopterin synthase sulfur carrier subunit